LFLPLFLALLIRILALTARILLLLAGLLTAALLLAGFLTRVLILLARILILIGHRGSPLLNVTRDNPNAPQWFQGNSGSAVLLLAVRNLGQMAYAQAPQAAPRAVAAPGSHC
jgi:hypothetical protein